jgi:hypothetical protein
VVARPYRFVRATIRRNSTRGADRRLPDDDPWKLALGRALDGLSGKIVTVDVWHLLGLHFYDRSIQEQRRLT